MDPLLLDLVEAGPADDEVAVVLKLRDGVVPPRIRLIARFDDIATCRVRRGDLRHLYDSGVADSWKAARQLSPDVEAALSVEEEPPVADPRERPPVPSGVTGKSVVVAHIDWGVDFTHADFRSQNGDTRLLAIWDQGIASEGHAPSPYGYGRLHTREDINRALRTAEPFKTLGYDPVEDDTGDGTHGTHTLGISAGNGRGGGPRGIAPDADLIFVQLAPWRGETELRLADSVTLLEALDFVRRTAGSRPWVVNTSLGAHVGPHDGTTLVEQALDRLVAGAPGRAVVQSVGNYFNKRIHTSGVLRPGQTSVFHVEIDPRCNSANEVDIWYSERDRVTVVLLAPDGRTSERVEPSGRFKMVLDGRDAARISNRAREPNTGDNNANIVFAAGAPAGTWEVRLHGDDIVNGRYEAWIERNDRPHSQARVSEGESVTLGTTGTICNGYRTIAVGAIDGRSNDFVLAPFASAGPTRKVRLCKPDLVAPGVSVLAARSARPGSSNGYVRKSGTSMSAPCVTGTVALMFEAAPRRLAIHETRALLLKAASPAPDDVDRERVGSGIVNIVAAVEAARAVPAHAPPAALADTEESTPETANEAPLERRFARAAAPAVENAAPERSDHFTAIDEFAPKGETLTMRELERFPSRPFPENDAETIESLAPRSPGLATVDLARAHAERAESGEDFFLAVIGDGFTAPGGARLAPDALYESVSGYRGSSRPVDTSAVEVVGRPGETLQSTLREGDVILRRLGNRTTHVAVVSNASLASAEDLSRRGVPAEKRLGGRFVEVIEPARGRGALGYGRLAVSNENVVPYDQVIVRLLDRAPPPSNRTRDGLLGARRLPEDNPTITLSTAELIVCVGGPTDTVTATATAGGTIAWTISDTAIADVRARGVTATVLGRHPGVTTITATVTLGAATATASVRLLVVYVDLTLKNTDVIVPAPENEDEANETAAAGTNALGPLAMGTGRMDPPFVNQSYISALMVIGRVFPPEAATRLTFRWERSFTERSWTFRRNGVAGHWTVAVRGVFGRTADTGNAVFNDATPSVPGRRIYIYDNPGSFLGPDALAAGEFMHSRRNFLYRVWVNINGHWAICSAITLGQVMTARRDHTTGTVATDWTGLENSTAFRTLTQSITAAEVRTIVGGADPIDFAPGANP